MDIILLIGLLPIIGLTSALSEFITNSKAATVDDLLVEEIINPSAANVNSYFLTLQRVSSRTESLLNPFYSISKEEPIEQGESRYLTRIQNIIISIGSRLSDFWFQDTIRLDNNYRKAFININFVTAIRESNI